MDQDAIARGKQNFERFMCKINEEHPIPPEDREVVEWLFLVTFWLRARRGAGISKAEWDHIYELNPDNDAIIRYLLSIATEYPIVTVKEQ